MTDRDRPRASPFKPRRRRRRWPIVLLLVGLPAAWLAWAVTWAFTATPVGSDRLEYELAAAAVWPDQGDSDPGAPGAAYAEWEEVVFTHAELVETSLEAAGLLHADLGSASLLDLDAPDDTERWTRIIESESRQGRAGSDAVRAMLRARADALRASPLVGQLAAIARGPRPAVGAGQAAVMGFGRRIPSDADLSPAGYSRSVARDLLGLARLEAGAGNASAVPEILTAVEGLARGAEALPHLIWQIINALIRTMAWDTVAELAARGELDESVLDAVEALVLDPDDALAPGVRTARALAGERTLLRGLLDHFHDASGRSLPATWAELDPGLGLPGGPLANLLGLFMPRRERVEKQIDDLVAGTAAPIPAARGIRDLLRPDLLAGIVTPDFDKARQIFLRAERMDTVGRVTTSIARHELATGQLPAALADLGLPAEATRDPYAEDGAELQYERLDPTANARGIRWRIWSIGPDQAEPSDDLVLPARERP